MAEPDPSSCFCGCGIKIQCSCNFRPGRFKFKSKKPPVYILLLGAAETGKSTIMRQMKIIHDGQMSADSLRLYKNHVITNVNRCVELLVNAVSSSGLNWSSEKAEIAANDYRNIKNVIPVNFASDQYSVAVLTHDHYQLINNIWKDEATQKCWNRANEFNLPDSTAYYLNSLNRILQPTYIPTQEDVLRLRLPTREATVYDFTDKDWTFQITDVGGQRGERRRWIRMFHEIDAIIFLAALSEYDQFWTREEEEDEAGINRLELSLRLFKETTSYFGFKGATIILFLNKVDVFQQKIRSSHLNTYFPNYRGTRCDYKPAAHFIRERFLENAVNPEKPKRNIYPHETCATDTDKTKVIFTVVRDDILWNILNVFFEPV